MKFKIGDTVKLKNYFRFGDWKIHKDQIATVEEIDNDFDDEFPITLRWADDEISGASPDDLIKATQHSQLDELEKQLTKR